jgi:F-type H+-transporting ATPase subunit a
MPEGHTWLSLLLDKLGLYEPFEHLLRSFGPSWLFGHPVHVQHVLAMLMVALVMAAVAVTARGQLERAGDDVLPEAKLSARTFVELLIDFILGIMQFTMPYEAAIRHFWLVGTLGFFVLFSNLLGVIPGFIPPTESLDTTLACGTIVFIYYNFYAFSKLGLGHLAHMANPVGEPIGWFLAPLMIIIELISHAIRPLSLAIRLMCNIAGDHLVLAVFVGLVPLLVPVPFLWLGLFVAFIQTLIFLLLSSVYIGEVEAIVAHHHHAHEHAKHPQPADAPSAAAAVHSTH